MQTNYSKIILYIVFPWQHQKRMMLFNKLAELGKLHIHQLGIEEDHGMAGDLLLKNSSLAMCFFQSGHAM